MTATRYVLTDNDPLGIEISRCPAFESSVLPSKPPYWYIHRRLYPNDTVGLNPEWVAASAHRKGLCSWYWTEHGWNWIRPTQFPTPEAAAAVARRLTREVPPTA